MPGMIKTFAHWYWLADDGRIFSSKALAIVPADDPDYLAWRAAAEPDPWPRDADGEQTLDIMGRALLPYGIIVGLLAYAADKRWRKEVGGINAGGVPVATDDRSKQMLMGARLAADADPTFTTPWVGSDNTVYQLTAPQIIGVSNLVLQHVATCFGIYAAMSEGIANNTITTRAQIDAAFA
jgi:hypothetical protein